MRATPTVLAVLALMPSQSRQQAGPVVAPTRESLQYAVEWRLIRAGTAKVTWNESDGGWEAGLQLQSTGLVSMLYRVDDLYKADLNRNLCAVSTVTNARELFRSRDTQVTYDAVRRKASYVEKDVKKDVNVASFQIDIPPCTHEILGALYALRGMKLGVGKSVDLPISDGKKSVMARVEAQQQETIATPSGTHRTIRYEAFLFNNVLYHRTGRLYVWLTDDDRRLPVQIRARLDFPVGTITLQLEKTAGV